VQWRICIHADEWAGGEGAGTWVEKGYMVKSAAVKAFMKVLRLCGARESARPWSAKS
jgi:hypothetical protein